MVKVFRIAGKRSIFDFLFRLRNSECIKMIANFIEPNLKRTKTLLGDMLGPNTKRRTMKHKFRTAEHSKSPMLNLPHIFSNIPNFTVTGEIV